MFGLPGSEVLFFLLDDSVGSACIADEFQFLANVASLFLHIFRLERHLRLNGLRYSLSLAVKSLFCIGFLRFQFGEKCP